MRTTVSHIFPPIPDRRFDYCATPEDYDGHGPIGYGRTSADAEADLASQIVERAEYEADMRAGR